MSQTTPPQTQTVTPNLFRLTDDGMIVVFSPTSINGQPTLTIQDQNGNTVFKGQDIRMQETALGTEVTATLRTMADVGSTTFTLLAPRVRVMPGAIVPVDTYAITTLVSTALIAPQHVQGQLDAHTIVHLHGTAQAVVF